MAIGVALNAIVVNTTPLKCFLVPLHVLTDWQSVLFQVADLGELAILLEFAVVQGGPFTGHVLVEFTSFLFVLLNFSIDSVERSEELLADGLGGDGMNRNGGLAAVHVAGR